MRLGDQVFLLYVADDYWHVKSVILVSKEVDNAIIIPANNRADANFANAKFVRMNDLFLSSDLACLETLYRNEAIAKEKEKEKEKEKVDYLAIFDLDKVVDYIMSLEGNDEYHLLKRITNDLHLNDKEGVEVAKLILAKINEKEVQKTAEVGGLSELKKNLDRSLNGTFSETYLIERIRYWLGFGDTAENIVVVKLVIEKLCQQNYLGCSVSVVEGTMYHRKGEKS